MYRGEKREEKKKRNGARLETKGCVGKRGDDENEMGRMYRGEKKKGEKEEQWSEMREVQMSGKEGRY